MEERRKREGKRGKEDSVVAFIRNPSVSLSATLVYRIRAVEGTRGTEKTTGKKRKGEGERARERKELGDGARRRG